MTLFQNKYRIESTRLPTWDYRSRGWYFVTICMHNRRHILGTIVENEVRLSPIGKIADAELPAVYMHYENVYVDEHIVMSNHVHAIFMIEESITSRRKPFRSCPNREAIIQIARRWLAVSDSPFL